MQPFSDYSIVILWLPAKHYTLYKEIQLIIYSYNMGTNDFLICMPKARGLWAYISGKPRVPMLQLLCYIYNKADSLNANANVPNHWILFICMPERFDYVVRKITRYGDVC